MTKRDEVAEALRQTLESPSLGNSSGDPANVVDVLAGLARAVRASASAISPADAAPGHDAAGGTVGSLTEAVMGVTAGLCRIADALGDVAEAIRERGPND